METSQTLELKIDNNPALDSDESFAYEKSLIESSFEGLESLQNINDKFFDTISALSKKLWTVAGEDPHYKPPIERNKFR